MKNNKGFTVVEMMLAIAIAASVTTMILSLLTSSIQNFNSTEADINIQNEAQVTMNMLSDYIMEARQIEELTKDIEGNTTKLQLYMGTTDLVKESIIIRYDVVDKKMFLQKKEDSSYYPEEEFAENIEKFVANTEYTDVTVSRLITIDLIVKKNKNSFTISNSIKLRNK